MEETWIAAHVVKTWFDDHGTRLQQNQVIRVSLSDLKRDLNESDSNVAELKTVEDLPGVNGIVTNFTIPLHSGVLMVFINGLLQLSSTYTDNGDLITFNVAPSFGDVVTVTYL